MKAYVRVDVIERPGSAGPRSSAQRCGEMIEHVLHGPLATCLGCVADHLPGRARETFTRIAKIDRERAPGNHRFDHADFVHLIESAHGLLADPPQPVRRLRRVLEGPLPAAERIGALLVWLHANRGELVVYDLWRSTEAGSAS